MTIAVRLTGALSEWTFGSGGVSQEANDIDRILVDERRPLQNEETRIAELIAGAEVPVSTTAINSAIDLLHTAFGRAMKLGSWSPPHITLSESAEIVFEWWHKDKKITLYFGDGEPEFIKVWGTDIETEMDSGVLTGGWPLTSLWLWLHS